MERSLGWNGLLIIEADRKAYTVNSSNGIAKLTLHPSVIAQNLTLCKYETLNI